MNEDKIKAVIDELVSPGIDAAYSQILNRKTRQEGLAYLENLRGQDKTIPVIIGNAHELEFYETGHQSEAEKAIQEYESAMMDGDFQFLQENIDRLKGMLP